jgi:release factor glutamine methyltransferase
VRFGAAESLAQARSRLAAALAGAGKEPAVFEARLLLEGASGLDSLALLTRSGERLGQDVAMRLGQFLERRLAGEPVNRILGRSGFYGLDLLVTADVLDPRGDTETLIHAALDFIGARRLAQPKILDLGTGSGAILCALLDSCPDAFGVGVDLSATACKIAQANVIRCGLAGRASVICADWAEALAGSFDLILSNPPYIALNEQSDLAREVADHDPALALYGGSDGFDCYRRIAPSVTGLLEPDGRAFFEIGCLQAKGVSAIFETVALRVMKVAQDSGGRDRLVILSKA